MGKSRFCEGAYVLGLILVLTFFAGRSALAATTWQATNQDVNTLDFSLIINILPTGNFYIFDDDAAGNLQTATSLQLANADLLTFSLNGANWDITGTNGTLSVTSAPNFLFAESVGGVFSQESGASMIGPNNWILVFGSGAQLQAVDVAPVPVPPAILLMGSGLVGLFGLMRKRKGTV